MAKKFELKAVSGRVGYVLDVGNNTFSGGTLPLAAAKRIVDEGQVTESDKPGFPICVDGEWYFEGKPVKEKRS